MANPDSSTCTSHCPSLSPPTANPSKTYLDTLPAELIVHILEYFSPNSDPTKSQLASFHAAWPNSRYALLSEPLLHGALTFDGSAPDFARILSGLTARPETRFWARELKVVEGEEYDGGKFMTGDAQELCSVQHALRQILPTAEEAKLALYPFPSANLAPYPSAGTLKPHHRVRALACLLPNLTHMEFGLVGLRGWAIGTTAEHVGYESHFPDLCPSTPPFPVFGKLKYVTVFCSTRAIEVGESIMPEEILWAFSLPKVRRIHGHRMRSTGPAASMLASDLPAYHKQWGMRGASAVEVLHVTECALSEAALEGLLHLPSRLKRFFYYHCRPWNEMREFMGGFSVGALARGLGAQAGSLESLVVKGGSYEGQTVKSERLGSLRGFTKLRELEVDLWMLAGPACSYIEGGGGQRVEDASVGLSGLPPGLLRLRLRIKACRKCRSWLCDFDLSHLGRLFECHGEWVPGLKRLEVMVKGFWGEVGPEGIEDIEHGLREMAQEKGATVEVLVSEAEYIVQSF